MNRDFYFSWTADLCSNDWFDDTTCYCWMWMKMPLVFNSGYCIVDILLVSSYDKSLFHVASLVCLAFYISKAYELNTRLIWLQALQCWILFLLSSKWPSYLGSSSIKPSSTDAAAIHPCGTGTDVQHWKVRSDWALSPSCLNFWSSDLSLPLRWTGLGDFTWAVAVSP